MDYLADVRTLLRAICASLILLCVSGCNNNTAVVQPNVLPQASANKYATYFAIHPGNTYTLVVTWLDAERTDSAIHVLYTGTAPELDKGMQYIRVPVTHAGCLGSVFAGFLNRLNVIDHLVAVDNLNFYSNNTLQQRAPQIKEVARNGQLNTEEAIAAGAEVLFTNPSGDKRRDYDSRLLSAGMRPFVCADYFEAHPLGRAEWIKVFGLLFNKARQSDSLFAETEKRYMVLKNTMDTVAVKPTVLTEIKTNATWFIAGGSSSLATLIADAGGHYLWKDNGKAGVTALNLEQVMERALQADYWLHQHLCNSRADMLKLDPRYGEFKAFKTGNVFNNNARTHENGANPYWEEGMCEPDQILNDLIQIFHPTLQSVRKLNYYQQLK